MYQLTTETIKIPHHNRTVNGVLYAPDTTDKYPIIIFSHGYNGSKKDFELSAKYLAQNGVGSLCYDFCGGSTKDESGIPTTSMTIFTEKQDLEAVIDRVKKLDAVDKENIFVFGGSQGGLVTALTVDSMSDEIKGMMLLYPAFCIADDWNERFKRLEDIPDEVELWGMKMGRVFFESIHGYDVFEHVGEYKHNVLVMHGDKDPIVAIGYSERICKIYEKVRLEVFEGEGHGFSPEADKRMREMVLDFVMANM